MFLSAEKVSKKFNRTKDGASWFYAVRETDISIDQGTLAAIFGKSGSGKTTLLNMLGGLLAPSEGVVRYGENDLYRLDDKALSLFRNRHIGMIPQGSTALTNLTVLENVLSPSLIYGKQEDGSISRAKELLKTVGIAELADAMPNELSGGELRRMAIARALMNSPDIILADEPTGDLDDENTQTVLCLLREQAERGAAVLIATHDSEARSYANIVLRMNAGKLEPAS